MCITLLCSPEEQKFKHCLSFTAWQRPIISICWGHRDSRLLMASGPALYVVRVEHRVSSLQLLCQQAIASTLREDKDVSKLTLPPRLCSYLSTAFIPTIKVKPSTYPSWSSFLSCLSPTAHQEESRDRIDRGGYQSTFTELTCFSIRRPEDGYLHGRSMPAVYSDHPC